MALPALSDRLIVGAGWLIAAKIAERALSVLSTLLLARLLIPEDFGLVAMAAPVIGVVELLGGLGIDLAILGTRKVDDRTLNAAWTLKVILGTVMAATLVLIAQPGAALYGEPRLVPILYWFALGIWIQGFENIGLIRFRHRVDMSRDASLLVLKKVVSLVVAVGAAFAGFGYWALVAGTLVSRLAGVAVSFMLTNFRPRWGLAGASGFFGFSMWLFVANLLYVLNYRTPEFVLGKAFGPEAVAIYALAYEVAAVATGELSAAIARATFPAFAEIAEDRSRLKAAVVKVLASVATISFPAAVGLYATAPTLVPVLLGDRWMATIDLMGPLALIWALMAVAGQLSYAYLALGKAKLTTALGAGYTLLLVAGLVFAVPSNGLAAIPVIFAGLCLYLFVAHSAVLYWLDLGLGPATWWTALWRPSISAGLMFAVLHGLDSVLGAPSLFKLAAMVAVGVAIYSASIAACWLLAGRPDGLERMLLRRFLQS